MSDTVGAAETDRQVIVDIGARDMVLIAWLSAPHYSFVFIPGLAALRELRQHIPVRHGRELQMILVMPVGPPTIE
jgi:hypothetical protein